MAFGVLDLALDVLKAFDVGLDKLGIERVAWSTPHDAQRESEPVRVLERHHRGHRLDLVLSGLLTRGDGPGQRVHPADIVVGEDVSNSGDSLSEVLRSGPIHGLPLLGPGVDFVVGDVPLVRHETRVDSQTGQCSGRVRPAETTGNRTRR